VPTQYIDFGVAVAVQYLTVATTTCPTLVELLLQLGVGGLTVLAAAATIYRYHDGVSRFIREEVGKPKGPLVNLVITILFLALAFGLFVVSRLGISVWACL